MRKTCLLLTGLLVCCLLETSYALPPRKHFFEVKRDHGVPRLYKDGRVIHPRLFFCNPCNMSYSFKDGDPTIPEREIRLAGTQGVDLVSVVLWMIWPGEGEKLQTAQVDQVMDLVLKGNPDAFVVPRLIFRPPGWWVKRYPEAMTQFDDGSRGDLPAYESPVFRKALREAIETTINHLEQKYGDHMAGYHLAGGLWSEWFYNGYGSNRSNWPGYDDATQTAFRAWLQERYHSDEALQKAWNIPVTMATAAPPAGDVLRTRKKGLHSPEEQARAIDFLRFLSESAAGTIASVAAETRKFVGPGRPLYVFYGYSFAINDFLAGPGRSGHLVQDAVLESPDIDVICSPFGYHDRKLGGAVPAQAAAESIMKRGKLYLSEDDTPTHLAVLKSRFRGLDNPQGWKAQDAKESRRLLRRNLAQIYAKNYAIWWMDLHGIGWFDDPELWREMENFRKIEAENLANPVPFEPEVAMAVDNSSLLHLFGEGASYRLYNDTTILLSSNLGHMGTPYGQYLMEDLIADRFPKIKLAIFSVAYALDGKQRAALRNYRKNHGCIWIYAPGIIDLDSGKFSLKAVEEATGFRVRQVQESGFGVNSDPAGSAAVKPYGIPAKYAWNEKVDQAYPENICLSPIPQPGDFVIARYASGAPAVVLRPNGKKPQLFSGTPQVPIALLRKMADLSGVRSYAQCGTVVYANGNFLAVSANQDGIIEIYPNQSGRYRDTISKRSLGEGRVLRVSMEKGETVIPELVPVQHDE